MDSRARRGIRGRAGVLLALAPLLAVAACEGVPWEAGHPVYDEKPSAQLAAAAKVTKEAGTARFTSSLVYGDGATRATDTTTGVMDFTRDTASGERALRIPDALPAKDARALGATGSGDDLDRDIDEARAVRTSSVYVPVRSGERTSWLRFSKGERKKFGLTHSDLARLNGAGAPYGGTLAETLRGAKPTVRPEKLKGGMRRYHVTVSRTRSLKVLPVALARTIRADGEKPKVTVTVDLNKKGELRRATADLTPLLAALHRADVLTDVSVLRADYRLTRLGKWQEERFPSGHSVQRSERVIVPRSSLKPGQCADTGLVPAKKKRVLKVDCADPHGVRAYAKVSVDETVTKVHGDDLLTVHKDDLIKDYGHAACVDRLAKAPKNVTEDVAEPATVSSVGKQSLQLTKAHGTVVHAKAGKALPHGTRLKVTGDFTCLVRTDQSRTTG
ncbi:hypothetical protein [Streptomyces tsukubensis]|uniref:Lipoprotein n=1 Tax=Streptomyces tsukubensis TaxID=83656 RepID=A0A1V4A9L4_9ACTN|nr:hypothetical protein [Streptomyces tsukubensis]OON79617.1 hypothetical protein B1H18_13655 [Streptomyces tsukubensis]QFR95802.1 hypothetical protein GBW32_25675 [Streptomyces tsukubensis]